MFGYLAGCAFMQMTVLALLSACSAFLHAVAIHLHIDLIKNKTSTFAVHLLPATPTHRILPSMPVPIPRGLQFASSPASLSIRNRVPYLTDDRCVFRGLTCHFPVGKGPEITKILGDRLNKCLNLKHKSRVMDSSREM